MPPLICKIPLFPPTQYISVVFLLYIKSRLGTGGSDRSAVKFLRLSSIAIYFLWQEGLELVPLMKDKHTGNPRKDPSTGNAKF